MSMVNSMKSVWLLTVGRSPVGLKQGWHYHNRSTQKILSAESNRCMMTHCPLTVGLKLEFRSLRDPELTVRHEVGEKKMFDAIPVR